MRITITNAQMKALEIAYRCIGGDTSQKPNTRALKSCQAKGLIDFAPTGFALTTPIGRGLLAHKKIPGI